MIDIKVGIGDLNVTKAPNRLITIGLGSCVGIALIDEQRCIIGLAHIMLHESKLFKNSELNPMKFADLAIPMLYDRMIKEGANKRNIVAKIAGGAAMFNFADKNVNIDVGSKNVEVVKNVLNILRIPVISEDVGGNKGRTMTVYSNGDVHLKVLGVGEKVI